MATTPGTDTNPLTTDRDFVFPTPGPAVMDGYYTLQIRRASDYGSFVGSLNPYDPDLTINRTFDINDQLSDGLSMTVPNANNISNGETFSVSDGVHNVTFQYLGQGVNDSISNPNDQPIYFTANETTAEIAAATVAAINLADSRGLFSVEATAGGVQNATLVGGVQNTQNTARSAASRTPVFSCRPWPWTSPI